MRLPTRCIVALITFLEVRSQSAARSTNIANYISTFIAPLLTRNGGRDYRRENRRSVEGNRLCHFGAARSTKGGRGCRFYVRGSIVPLPRTALQTERPRVCAVGRSYYVAAVNTGNHQRITSNAIVCDGGDLIFQIITLGEQLKPE
ncbi:hypothetical protein PUN28_003196 [Cardiocondyla obscurior]|uniref:Secreted protein n=1 Tax=Cardiocondyla obscurior TaxID=286306 RepID=A0AAW2GMT1_9HYME